MSATVRAVSYTHLIANTSFAAPQVVDKVAAVVNNGVVLESDVDGLMPVSYTHLDVYKRQPKKQYVARVWGHPSPAEGLVDLPLICDWPNRPKQDVYKRQISTITGANSMCIPERAMRSKTAFSLLWR